MNTITNAHIDRLQALKDAGATTKKQVTAFANKLLADGAITQEVFEAIKACTPDKAKGADDCLEIISNYFAGATSGEALHPEYAEAMASMPAEEAGPEPVVIETATIAEAQPQEAGEPDLDAEWEKMLAEKAAANPPAKSGKKPRVNRSSIQSPCKTVWDLADSMPGATRKEVVAAAEAAGVAHYTAKTQYQQWFTAKKASAPKA